MFYLIAFIIIIIFIINSWKSIKTLDYYQNHYQNHYSNKDTFENTKNFEQDSIFKHKFLPHNYAESSKYTLDLSFEKEQEIEEKNLMRKYKYVPSYPSSMLYNENYFNKEKEKYISNPLKRPLNFNCQRQWFSQCG